MVPLLVHPFSCNEPMVVRINPVAAVDSLKWYEKSQLKWLTLFVTSGTLLCCALPILLVSAGLGSVVASIHLNVPGFMFMAEHKLWTLVLSALLLMGLAFVIWRPNQTCPADPQLAKYCSQSKRWNQRIFLLSIAIWMTGFFFSVMLLPIRQWLDTL